MKPACGHVIAGCFALSGFCVSILAGLAGDVPATNILWRAILAMMICYPVGLAAGMVCDHVVAAHLAQQPQPGAATADDSRAETAHQAVGSRAGAAGERSANVQ